MENRKFELPRHTGIEDTTPKRGETRSKRLVAKTLASQGKMCRLTLARKPLALANPRTPTAASGYSTVDRRALIPVAADTSTKSSRFCCRWPPQQQVAGRKARKAARFSFVLCGRFVRRRQQRAGFSRPDRPLSLQLPFRPARVASREYQSINQSKLIAQTKISLTEATFQATAQSNAL